MADAPGYGTSMHEPHCRDRRCTGCLPPRPAGDPLAEVYAQVSTVECKLLCQDSCHDVPLLTAERDRLGDLGTGVCPNLNGFGLCSVHEERPLMCRLWAVAENMPCPHGCTPTRTLPIDEARQVVAAAETAGGGWVNA